MTRLAITYGPGGSCDCPSTSAGCEVNPEPHDAGNVVERVELPDEETFD